MFLTEQLDRLTPAHLKTLEKSRSHWRNVGLSVAETDKSTAVAGLKLAYSAARLPEPKILVWLDSARAGATAVRLLNSDLEWPVSLDPSQKAVWDQVWKQCVNQVKPLIGLSQWAETRTRLQKEAEQIGLKKHGRYIEKSVKEDFGEYMGIWIWKYLRQMAGAATFHQIRRDVEQVVNARVSEKVAKRVREELYQELVPPIGQQVFQTIGEPVRQMIGTNNGVLTGRLTWECGFGHLDASWIAYYDVLAKLGITGTEPLDGIKQLTQSSGWWWPYENICFLTRRPVEMHRDNRGRLHNETGMAIRYADGWGFYAWHGILVPEYVILLPEPIDHEMINAEPNAEVRRVLIERFGLDNYLKEGMVLKVHQDQCGALYRMNLRGDEPILVVRVVNSTAEPDGTFNEYFLRVPPEMIRARQAVAWTFGLTEEEYAPLIQT